MPSVCQTIIFFSFIRHSVVEKRRVNYFTTNYTLLPGFSYKLKSVFKKYHSFLAYEGFFCFMKRRPVEMENLKDISHTTLICLQQGLFYQYTQTTYNIEKQKHHHIWHKVDITKKKTVKNK